MIRSHKAHRRLLAVGLAGAALAAGGPAPSIAVAQSAGDEQYADPLAQEEPGANPQSGSGGGGGGNSGAGSGSAPSQTLPTQQSSADSVQSAATVDAPAQTGLPDTGLDVAPVAGAGALLLVTGAALLWLVRPARRRRRRQPVVLFHRPAPRKR